MTWYTCPVRRPDAGGALFNSVWIDDILSVEHWSTPSYDREAIDERTQMLNANGVDPLDGEGDETC